MNESRIQAIAGLFAQGDASNLRPFLRVVQSTFNWIPPEALGIACDHFRVSYPRVYEEAALNPEFCLEPRGDTVISVCRGLACSEAFASEVLKDWEKALGIREGSTSEDHKFSLCSQSCFGRCAVGPNIRIGQQYFSGQEPGMAQSHLKAVVDKM